MYHPNTLFNSNKKKPGKHDLYDQIIYLIIISRNIINRIDCKDKRNLDTPVIVSRKCLSEVCITSASIVHLENRENFLIRYIYYILSEDLKNAFNYTSFV